MGAMSPTLPHPSANPLSKAIRAEARAKKAYSTARFVLQDAREDHAAAIAAEDAARAADDAARAAEDAARVALQKAQERHAAATLTLTLTSKAAAAALQHVQANEVAEAKANAELQLAQRALKRERAAAAIPSCPEFKEKCLAFFSTLGVHKAYLNRRFDRCYCRKCYAPSFSDTITDGSSKPYVVPRGFFRVGLDVPARAKALDIFNKWFVYVLGFVVPT